MMDPMSAYSLTRLRHEELMREALADCRAEEARALGAPRIARESRWRQVFLAWVVSIIERFRVATRLESPGG